MNRGESCQRAKKVRREEMRNAFGGELFVWRINRC